MLVDFEAAWLALREHVLTKSGHGSFGPEGLLAVMAQLEVSCAVTEGPTERVLRLFGVEVSQDLLSIVDAATERSSNGDQSSSSSTPTPEEPRHAADRHRDSEPRSQNLAQPARSH